MGWARKRGGGSVLVWRAEKSGQLWGGTNGRLWLYKLEGKADLSGQEGSKFPSPSDRGKSKHEERKGVYGCSGGGFTHVHESNRERSNQLFVGAKGRDGARGG